MRSCLLNSLFPLLTGLDLAFLTFMSVHLLYYLFNDSTSIYTDKIVEMPGSPEWRRVEAILNAELLSSHSLRLAFMIMEGPYL